MLGPSPLSGRLVARAGAVTTVLAGLAILSVVGFASAVTGASSPAQTTIGLLLIGLGWNVGLVGGSAMLATASTDDARPHLEAIGEIAMGAGAAVSAPLAGLAISTGLSTVWLSGAVIAALATVLLIGSDVVRRRPTRPSCQQMPQSGPTVDPAEDANAPKEVAAPRQNFRPHRRLSRR